MIVKENMLQLPKGYLASQFSRLAPGEPLFGMIEKSFGSDCAFRRFPLIAEKSCDGNATIIILPNKAKDDAESFSTKAQLFFLPNINRQNLLMTAPKTISPNYIELLGLLSLFTNGVKIDADFVKSLRRQSGSLEFCYSAEKGLYLLNYNCQNNHAFQIASEMIDDAIGKNLLALAAFAKEIGVLWIESAYFASQKAKNNSIEN